MRLAFAPYLLKFGFPGGTSRGVMTEKPTFLLKIYDERNPSRFGIGEAGVFPGLSPEADGRYVYKLLELLANIAIGRSTDLTMHPSIQSGLEQAIRDFTGGCRGIYYPSEFTEGNKSIEINGLVWMADFDLMVERLRNKVAEGFRCIKLKIGAIDWNRELEMIRIIRNEYSERDLTVRVDANGAFKQTDVIEKLSDLADLGVESIEQPVKAGETALMADICRKSPVPVALDEELIGKFTTEQKTAMLEAIMPAFIVLKPSLIGGFSSAEEWISLATDRGIGWWVTSALESNVGLNALAQWTATLDTTRPQGLGTGNVFTNNFNTPVRLEGDRLMFDNGATFDYSQFAGLHWNE